jgi:dynein heavy chain
LYLNTLDIKRVEYNLNRSRLANGLKKLNDTNKSIAELRVKLTELQPMLQKKNEDLKVALERVNADKKVANEKAKIVDAEAAIVNESARQAEEIEADALKDLADVQPEIDAAQASLKKLDKSAITEVKSFNSPHKAVEMVLFAVMVLLGEKQEWNNVKIVLGDVQGFINKLLDYDVSKTPESTLTKVRNTYLKLPDFDPVEVGKKS